MPKVMKSMNIISRCQALFRAEQITEGEPEPCYFAPLFVIVRSPGLSQEQIARELCFNKSTVARAISRLEEEGYAERRVSSLDKRVLLVYPTERAAEIMPRVREITRAWNQKLTEGISDERMAVFASVLSELENNARRAVDMALSEEGEK